MLGNRAPPETAAAAAGFLAAGAAEDLPDCRRGAAARGRGDATLAARRPRSRRREASVPSKPRAPAIPSPAPWQSQVKGGPQAPGLERGGEVGVRRVGSSARGAVGGGFKMRRFVWFPWTSLHSKNKLRWKAGKKETVYAAPARLPVHWMVPERRGGGGGSQRPGWRAAEKSRPSSDRA